MVWNVRVGVRGEGWLGETTPLAAEADAEGVEGSVKVGENREKSNKAVNRHALVEVRLDQRLAYLRMQVLSTWHVGQQDTRLYPDI